MGFVAAKAVLTYFDLDEMAWLVIFCPRVAEDPIPYVEMPLGVACGFFVE